VIYLIIILKTDQAANMRFL